MDQEKMGQRLPSSPTIQGSPWLTANSILHAYKKQGQKAPVRGLDVARRRMKEILGE